MANWWDKLSDADLRAEATKRYRAGRLSDGEMAAIQATRGNPEDPLYQGDPTQKGPAVEVGPATIIPQAQVGEANIRKVGDVYQGPGAPMSPGAGATADLRNHEPHPLAPIPTSEPAGPLVMGNTESRTPFGTQKVVGNNIPRGVGNQFAAAGGLPSSGQETPRDTGDLDTSKAAIYAQELDAQEAAARNNPDPNAKAMAGIDFSRPDVKSQSTMSQTLWSPGERQAQREMGAAQQEGTAAIKTQAEHQRDALTAEYEARGRFVDDLAARSTAHQAQVDARKAQVADAMAKVDAASKAYQDEVNNLPLGTVLNPTTAQRMGGAIAMALGAFGSTLAHGQNAALAVLDRQLDAAKEERKNRLIGKSRAINAADRHLEQLRDVFKDDDAAFLAWKADQFDLFGERLKRTAALTGAQDKIDAAAVQTAAANERGAALRMQAEQVHDKHIQAQTQTESGPSVALRAMKLAGDRSKMPNADQNKVMEVANIDLMRREVAYHIKNGTMPTALSRVIQAYGGDIHSLGTALADGFSKADLTPEQKDAVGATFGMLNAAILYQTGKAMNQAEAPRVKLETGLGDNSTPADILNGVLRIGRKVNMWRGMQEELNGGKEMWQAHDRALEQTGVATVPSSAGPNYGRLGGN